jgi:O-antigen/teichoic acid export membrane protein
MTGPVEEGVQAQYRRKIGFLVRSAASLVSTSVVTSGLGFVYWTVAARMFSASEVGEAATAIAAMSLIAQFTVLGFGTALVFKLPTMASGRAELVSTAVVVCAVVGGAVALVCAVFLPDSFLGLPGVGHDLFTTLLFAGGIAAHSVAMMLDSALLSVAGGGIQLGRNVIHAIAKLVLLIVFALTLHRYGSMSIYASWFIATVGSIAVVVVWMLYKYRTAFRNLWPRLSALRGLQFQAAQHHLLNLALVVPFFAMPIVANVILGSEEAGYLYATWSLAGFVFVLPIAMSMALFASGAKDSSTILLEFRFTLRNAMAACLAANLLILPFGGLVLGIFGPAYAENGRLVLIVLCLGGLGLVIRDHHVAVARITGAVGREAVLMVGLGACELAGAAIGASKGGLIGLSMGWLVAVVLEVVVCTPLVWRAYRGRITIANPTTPEGHP